LAATLALTLSACGGESSQDALTQASAAERTVRALVTNEPVGPNCAAGGARIDGGIDTNGNGVLDPSENTSTQYVCNGTPGATGATGSTGATGLSMLTRLDAEPAGANCAAGGTKISVGLDSNGNGVLDTSEVSGTPSYVCGGTPGVAGSNGTTGATGVDGTNGTDGLSSLIVMTAESPGVNCTYGGTRVVTGLDANRNGVLDVNEAGAPSYNCNGAPGAAGAGITWVDVVNTSFQAVSGVGYVADNASQVTITLPPAPAIGDLVEVTGVGAGGWKIAPSGSQSIITKTLPANYANFDANWTPDLGAGVGTWKAVASSADGQKLVAGGYNANIYTSTDAGVTWTARDSSRSWNSIASSADGVHLVATASTGSTGNIYTSVDSGATWVLQPNAGTPANGWAGVASSADGSKLVAAAFGEYLYTSTDSGVTWTQHSGGPNDAWVAVASSADGINLMALSEFFNIYTSTDSGATWTMQSGFGNHYWNAGASSADGTKLVAAPGGGQLYISSDSGVTWTPTGPSLNWYSVACSADGSKLVAVAWGDQIYVSTDSGLTWTARDSSRSWDAVAMSSDGTKVIAGAVGDNLYRTLNDRTTAGSGYLTGSQYDTVTLQYLGNDLFLPLSATSYSGDFTVY
jgi:photosystem II stability/assembly factor-like uncharacterized protein